MDCEIAAILMTLSVLEDHSSIANFVFVCNTLCITYCIAQVPERCLF